MRDPLIHAPKDVILTHAFYRELIADAVGLAVPAPKTVTTGCGRRRAYAMTSADPVAVTCLACREHSAAQHDEAADMSESALQVLGAEHVRASTTVTPEALSDNARHHRATAEAFRGLP